MAIVTEARKKILRSEMKRRLQVAGNRRGAMKTAGGQHKNVGSTKGSKYRMTMAGFEGLNKDERAFIKTERTANKASGEQKKTYRGAFKLGSTNEPYIKQAKKDKMKNISKGGTVGKGTHSSGAARKEALAWRRKHIAALKKKHNMGSGSTATSRKAYVAARDKVINRHKKMVKKA